MMNWCCARLPSANDVIFDIKLRRYHTFPLGKSFAWTGFVLPCSYLCTHTNPSVVLQGEVHSECHYASKTKIETETMIVIKMCYQTTTPPLPPKSTQIFIVKMFSDKCVTLSPRSMLPPLPTVRVFLGVGCLAMIDRLLRYLLAWWCCSTPQQSVAAEISRIWLSLLQRLMLLIAAVSQAIKAL